MEERCPSTARGHENVYECSLPLGHEGLHGEDGVLGFVAAWTDDDEEIDDDC